MCMICRGLKNNKLTLQEAIEKYEEFIDLDLLDEDHQEKVESLIAEIEEEQYYWSSAKRDVLLKDMEDDILDEDFLNEEEDLLNDEEESEDFDD